jgi:hypothetical protein
MFILTNEKIIINYIKNIAYNFLYKKNFNLLIKNDKIKNDKIKNDKIKNDKINSYKNKWKLFINYNYNHNLYINIGNDHYTKFTLNNKLELNNVMNEIHNDDNIDINKPLIYLIRIWNYRYNLFAYKVGYTTNLSQRLIDLNNYYECYWRIIIIVCINVDNIKIEKQIHNELSINYEKIIINNPIKCKSNELYNISLQFYNDFIIFIEKINIKYFESNNYLYENNIEKIYDEEMNNIKLLEDEDNYIYLDQNINENKYWLYKHYFSN